MRLAGIVHRLLPAAEWCALGFGVGLLGAVVLPLAAGFRSLTVMSGSMSPTIGTGDVVVVRTIAPLQARPGDVVTFSDPDEPDRLITHRVTSMRVEGRRVTFETKGDANNTPERWVTNVGGSIGRVQFRVRWIGYGLHRLASPIGRVVLVVLPALGLGVLALTGIWRSRPRGTVRVDTEHVREAAHVS